MNRRRRRASHGLDHAHAGHRSDVPSWGAGSLGMSHHLTHCPVPCLKNPGGLVQQVGPTLTEKPYGKCSR